MSDDRLTERKWSLDWLGDQQAVQTTIPLALLLPWVNPVWNVPPETQICDVYAIHIFGNFLQTYQYLEWRESKIEIGKCDLLLPSDVDIYTTWMGTWTPPNGFHMKCMLFATFIISYPFLEILLFNQRPVILFTQFFDFPFFISSFETSVEAMLYVFVFSYLRSCKRLHTTAVHVIIFSNRAYIYI